MSVPCALHYYWLEKGRTWSKPVGFLAWDKPGKFNWRTDNVQRYHHWWHWGAPTTWHGCGWSAKQHRATHSSLSPWTSLAPHPDFVEKRWAKSEKAIFCSQRDPGEMSSDLALILQSPDSLAWQPPSLCKPPLCGDPLLSEHSGCQAPFKEKSCNILGLALWLAACYLPFFGRKSS